jgi:3-oxoacid CoA-transferase subunit A
VVVVLSHTAPLKYEPREMFLNFIDDSKVDKSTEIWLDSIEDRLDYDCWYCGHYHTEKSVDKVRFLYQDLIEFKQRFPNEHK